jgi:hypothetical protein
MTGRGTWDRREPPLATLLHRAHGSRCPLHRKKSSVGLPVGRQTHLPFLSLTAATETTMIE